MNAHPGGYLTWLAPGRLARVLAPMFVVALLAGCGSADSTPLAVTPLATAPGQSAIATPPLATPTPREPQFSDIVWTSEWSDQPGEEPVAVTELTPESPVIVALTRATALPIGAQLDATWTYNNTSLDAFSTSLVNDGSSDEVWLAFRLDRDPELLWPAGTYQVTLSLNGIEVKRGSVQVVETQ